MPETLEDFLMMRPPTAEQPLLGQTVLTVEDSRFASDALRLICQRSGARMRRADSLVAARRHLQAYRPGIVLVDIGLPDGSGLELIGDLARADPRVDAIFAMSGDDTLAPSALEAGADGFIAKPITSILAFQTRMLAALNVAPMPVTGAGDAQMPIQPDKVALEDDLSRIADMLGTPDGCDVSYAAGFLSGLAKGASDEALSDVALLAAELANNGATPEAASRLREAVCALIGRSDDTAIAALKRG